MHHADSVYCRPQTGGWKPRQSAASIHNLESETNGFIMKSRVEWVTWLRAEGNGTVRQLEQGPEQRWRNGSGTCRPDTGNSCRRLIDTLPIKKSAVSLKLRMDGARTVDPRFSMCIIVHTSPDSRRRPNPHILNPLSPISAKHPPPPPGRCAEQYAKQLRGKLGEEPGDRLAE